MYLKPETHIEIVFSFIQPLVSWWFVNGRRYGDKFFINYLILDKSA